MVNYLTLRFSVAPTVKSLAALAPVTDVPAGPMDDQIRVLKKTNDFPDHSLRYHQPPRSQARSVPLTLFDIRSGQRSQPSPSAMD